MKRSLFLALLLLGAFALVACGDDEAGDGANDEGGTAAAATVSTAGSDGTGTATAATSSETPIPAPSEVVASTYSIPTSALPVLRFHTAEGEVDLPVEVPPRHEYSIGLSGRTALEDGRGMLFYREDFGQTGFWMHNTHIDLDIAFVAASGEVLLVTTMIADTTDIHRPDGAYVAAIEARAGWYAEHGVQAGDQVEYLFDLDATVED